MKLSAVLIVKNEEALLERCLSSIQGVDETIVCDTGSEDNTVEIAKKFTDKVFTDYTWEDSFEKARNHAKSKATGDWILSIDADEYLSSTIDEVRDAIEKFKSDPVINITVESERGGKNTFPRLIKNIPEVQWKGDIHNYLSHTANNMSDIKIIYGYSPAHKKDPDRALRILTKVVNEKPESVRERYYLAREYLYRGRWQECIDMLDTYLAVAYWTPEIAEAHFMKARCFKKLNRFQEATDSCWKALSINMNFKDAALLMGSLMGPINSERWREIAEMADNSNVLFTLDNQEKDKDYYNKLFQNDTDMSRYTAILEEIGELTNGLSVLDIGCGLGELQNHIDDYSGFDISEEAIKVAGDKCWIGSAYDKENYKDKDVYVATEVLEHIDDMAVINNLKEGQRFIFTVPSFDDPSHIRTFSENIIKLRYAGVLKVDNIIRFNWDGKKWIKGGDNTKSYILLANSVKI